MEEFTIKIAGVALRIVAQLSETKEYCRDFFTEEEPRAEIVLSQQDRMRAQRIYSRIDAREGRTDVEYKETLLENTALHLRVLDELIRYGAVMFHGCAVAVNGKAYLFCADSGTGKTTHAELWLKNFPESYVLNGDKPLLIVREGKVFACDTPWRGKEHYGTNEILPLGGICLLERDAENHIDNVTYKESFDELFRHSYRPGDSEDLLSYMKLMQMLVAVPIYRLGCNMEDEAAQISYNAMVKV